MQIKRIDIFYILLVGLVVLLSVIQGDNIYSILCATFGIIYTILNGKKRHVGYVFGIISAFFGICVSYNLALWGNVTLHVVYYLPFMFLGFFNWKRNLDEKNEVKIEKIAKQDCILGLLVIIIGIPLLYKMLVIAKDAMPMHEAIIIVLSIVATYFGVKRYSFQWLLWTFANFISVIMWFTLWGGGATIFAMLLIRIIYLMLGIWFFVKWQKLINVVDKLH